MKNQENQKNNCTGAFYMDQSANGSLLDPCSPSCLPEESTKDSTVGPIVIDNNQ